MVADPGKEYRECKERLAKAPDSELLYCITKYQEAGKIRRFFMDLSMIKDYYLEAKVAEEIIEERKKDFDKWRASAEPGKIN